MENDERAEITMGSDGVPILLSKQQESCVNFKGGKTQLVVKGVAGSGKSVVLMAKAKKMVDGFKPGVRNEVAVLSYTNSLVRNAQDYLDPNEQMKDFVTISTLESYIQTVVKSLRRFADYPVGNHVNEESRRELMQDVLRKRSKVSDHRFYKIDESKKARVVSFWLEECSWIMGMGITVNDMSLYISTPRKGRGHAMNITDVDKPEAFRIYRSYIQELRSRKLVDYMEMHLFVRKHIADVPESLRFNYTFIDEAQDFPLIDVQIAIGLTRKGIMLAMDANQRLYRNHWSLSDLGIKVTSRHLRQSFRCTVQIDQFAEALRVKNEEMLDQDDKCTHVTPEYEGDKPLVIEAKDAEDEMDTVYLIVHEFLRNQKATTAIILRTKEEVEEWSEFFASKSIVHDKIVGRERGDWYNQPTYRPRSPGLKICTINSAKGLEFHNVVLPSFMNARYPSPFDERGAGMLEEEWVAFYRNLAYVAMTRAKVNLVVTFYGKPSRFLDEITESCEGDYHGVVDPEDNLFNYVTSDDLRSDDMFMGELVEPSSEARGTGDARPEDVHPEEEARMRFLNSLSRAESGDIAQILEVARCYQMGMGAPMDRKKAIAWYAHGAKMGDATCQLEFSKALWDGTYVDRNQLEAMNWLRKSAEGGDPEAQFTLASRIVALDGSKAQSPNVLNLLYRSADGGYMNALELLCKMYVDAPDESPFDHDRFEGWLTNAVERGSAICQYIMGLECLEEGDVDTAFYLIKEAASKGIVEAQQDMSKFYRDGVGTDVDFELSRQWSERAERTCEATLDLRETMLTTLDQARASSEDGVASRSIESLADEAGISEDGSVRKRSARTAPPAKDIITLLKRTGLRYKDERTSKGYIEVAWHESIRDLDSELERFGYKAIMPRKNSSRTKWVKLIRN